jgi:regulatory protein
MSPHRGVAPLGSQPAMADGGPAAVQDGRPSTAPDRGLARLPNDGPAAPRDGRPSTAPDRGLARLPDHAPAAPRDGRPSTAPDRELARLPDHAPAAPRDGGPATAPDRGLARLPDHGPAAPRDGGPLESESRLQRALDLGYRHLGKRDRTEAEVRRHLAARDIDEASIDGALEALVRQGYVDDARYSRTFAEDRRALDDWGAERIERRLIALGIAPELVAEAVSARNGADELEAAVALLRRRLRATPETDRDRDRALGMLARKGYDLDLAYDAVRAYCDRHGA